jgi:transposase
MDLSPAELRHAAAASRDARASRRMLAVALLLEGRCSRAEAAQMCGMERQTLRDWVHRYNAEGLPGLVDRRGAAGAKPRLTPEQEAQVDAWVESGPDPAMHGGLVRWRRIDLRDLIAREFGVTLHERSVGKLLRRLDFRRLSVRPQHPRGEPAAQEAFKKTSPPWRPRSSRPKPPAMGREAPGENVPPDRTRRPRREGRAGRTGGR